MSDKVCPYCFRQMEMDAKSNAKRTKDHVIPRADGGKVTVFACWQCNNDKANLPLKVWHDQLVLKADPRAKHVAWFLAEHFNSVLQIEEAAGGNRGVILDMTEPEKLIVNAAASLVFGLRDEQEMTRKQRAKAAYFARDTIQILSRAGYLISEEPA